MSLPDWSLEFALHWPHDRFAIGWEFVEKDDEYAYNTFKIFLFIITITYNHG